MRDDTIRKFQRKVWSHYSKHGRHDLPWRRTKDPYKILVSEVMLQQTQVPRVIEKYKEFLKAFPHVRALVRAPLADVLRIWSGMGYNRRAKFLHDAAKNIVERYGGKIPKNFAALRTLPGIGPYTANAVRVFAFNLPDILIETNIRAAFIHHFYSNVLKNIRITDAELSELATVAAKGQNPRKWHWALMDYGAHIKRLHGNPARRSAHYTRQSKFEGSLRQVRGAILRELRNGSLSKPDLTRKVKPYGVARGMMGRALEGLSKDGLIKKEKGEWRIA